jgi:class 3 adenylate cyclase
MRSAKRRADPAAAQPDTDTVTTLFADIEGSSEVAESLGDDQWVRVLAAFESAVRDAVKACGGNIVKSQGDGFMIVFSSARRALDCALRISALVDERNGTGWPARLKVRMGVHTGEAIRVGSDFLGRNVIVAARIAGQARGGEILASQVTKEVIEGANNFDFDDGREVRLKGLRGMFRVFRVKRREPLRIVEGLA